MIRAATPDDAPGILAMGRALLEESPKYQAMQYDEAKLMQLGERLTSALLSEHAAVLVAERRGVLLGMIVLVVAERFFGGDRYVTDLTVYVRPEVRGGLVFARLIQAAEAWARERGVRDCAFGVSTEIDAERTVCAYQRMGYRLTGYTLTKTLTDGN